MEGSVLTQPLEAQNLLSLDLFDWNLAGMDRFLIHEDSISSSECLSAAIIGAG